jgi:hypothetical protein
MAVLVAIVVDPVRVPVVVTHWLISEAFKVALHTKIGISVFIAVVVEFVHLVAVTHLLLVRGLELVAQATIGTVVLLEDIV